MNSILSYLSHLIKELNKLLYQAKNTNEILESIKFVEKLKNFAYILEKKGQYQISLEEIKAFKERIIKCFEKLMFKI